MSKRNIAIAAAAVIFAVAGVVYTQQSGSDEVASEATTAAETNETKSSAAPEAINASVSTDNSETNTEASTNEEQNTTPTAVEAPATTESE